MRIVLLMGTLVLNHLACCNVRTFSPLLPVSAAGMDSQVLLSTVYTVHTYLTEQVKFRARQRE